MPAPSSSETVDPLATDDSPHLDPLPGSEPAEVAPALVFTPPQPAYLYDNELTTADGLLRLVPQEKPLGGEDRVQITATHQLPYRQIGQLLAEFTDGYVYIGTGTLIGPCHVLTAAHNLYNPKTKHRAKRITFTPGRCGDKVVIPDGWCRSTEYRIASGYTTEQPGSDYALIYLPIALGNPLGTMRVRPVEPAEIRGKIVTIAGYAEDKDKERGRYLWASANQIENANAAFLWYLVDTGEGQSGSPIYMKKDGQDTIIGIHTNHEEDCNRGVRIGKEVFNQLAAWVELNPYDAK